MRLVTALGGTLLLILLPWLASTSPASAQERGQPADAVTTLRGPPQTLLIPEASAVRIEGQRCED